MEKHYLDDTFLARWISGDLTEEELEDFKKSKDYDLFKNIDQVSQQLKVPEYNKAAALENIKTQIHKNKQEKAVVKLIPNWVYAAAAVLVIAFGIFKFIQPKSQYNTGFGEQLALTLPDNSKVNLNANSQLNFNPKNWEDKREVKLQGEAFFDVEQGATFKVQTNVGTVEVLGTEFNVIATQNYFEVQCHEGRVKVKDSIHETILIQGKAIRIVGSEKQEWSFTETKPTWLHGETTFNNAPLSQVIKALENQFKLTFDASKIDTTQKFKGGFPHNSLKTALKLVFKPLDISYTIKDKNKIILVSNSKK